MRTKSNRVNFSLKDDVTRVITVDFLMLSQDKGGTITIPKCHHHSVEVGGIVPPRIIIIISTTIIMEWGIRSNLANFLRKENVNLEPIASFLTKSKHQMHRKVLVVDSIVPPTQVSEEVVDHGEVERNRSS